jgi:hypothetical protein
MTRLLWKGHGGLVLALFALKQIGTKKIIFLKHVLKLVMVSVLGTEDPSESYVVSITDASFC